MSRELASTLLSFVMWFDSIREFGGLIRRGMSPKRFESEMDEELQFHIDMHTDRLMQTGLSQQEARRQALVEFGGIDQIQEKCRDTASVRLINDLVGDIAYAGRTFKNSPVFFVVSVLTLAIGIGANTAVFSAINTLLIQPLPFAEPDRLVTLWQQNAETGFVRGQVAWRDYHDWTLESTSFESLGYVVNMTAASRNLFLTTANRERRIRGRHVSASLFDVLGVKPALGEALQSSGDLPGGPKQAVLSHELWMRLYAGEENIIGQRIHIAHEKATIEHIGGEATYVVTGVMPRGFRFPMDAEIWLSVAGWSEGAKLNRLFRRRDHHGMWVIGRLRHGVSEDQAREELNAIQAAIAADPDNRDMIRLANEVVVTPLLDQVNGQNTKSALWLLQGAVLCVLLIACLNVANLSIARASSRRKEIAVRVALGASKFRVVRQLLTESLCLSIVGAIAGLVLAWAGIEFFGALHTDTAHLGVKELRFNRWEHVSIDQTVLLFTSVVALSTGLVFGLLPALGASQFNIVESLKQGNGPGRDVTAPWHRSGGGIGRRGRWLRGGLLVTEVALAFVLLVGFGMTLRAFSRIVSADPGMRTDSVLRADCDLHMAEKLYGPDAHAAFAEVLRRISAVPGVVEVSACGEDPLNKSGWNDTFKILNSQHDALDLAELPTADVRTMGPGAFSTLGIPLLEGRDFSEQDDHNSPNVTIINEALRRRCFGTENPIGRTIQMRGWRGHEKQIVGVVGSVRNYSGQSVNQPELYFPFRQSHLFGLEIGPVVLVRTEPAAKRLIPAIRKAAGGAESDLPVLVGFATMQDVLAKSAAEERFQTVMLGVFAATAILLAIVGVYGVIAYSTHQRTGEFGIRLALGARPSQILGAVLKQGIGLCAVGIALGIAMSIGLAKILQQVSFGMESLDLMALTAVSLTLMFVGVIASLVPAYRATHVNPVDALRHE